MNKLASRNNIQSINHWLNYNASAFTGQWNYQFLHPNKCYLLEIWNRGTVRDNTNVSEIYQHKKLQYKWKKSKYLDMGHFLIN